MGAVELAPRGGQGDGAAQLGRVPGSGSHLAQALGSCTGTSQWSGHQDHPRSHPRPSSRSGVAQPAQAGTQALQEAASAQESRRGCYHPPPQHPRSPFTTLGSVGRKETFPNTCPLGPPPSLAGGTHLCRVTVPLPAPPVLPGHLPRSWAEFKAAGTIPWQSKLIWSHP